MVKHIFVGIDLGDKNSVARIAVDRDKTERLGFVNDHRGRARLFEELKRRAEKAGEAEIVMAYEASACGFILCDEAEGRGIRCWVRRLSRKLCLKAASSGRLEAGLKHRIEL